VTLIGLANIGNAPGPTVCLPMYIYKYYSCKGKEKHNVKT